MSRPAGKRPAKADVNAAGRRQNKKAKAAPPERTLLLPGGGHYIGDFNAHFRPHGEGIKFCADGSMYASGQWRDGKLHGRGKLLGPNGDRYEGSFVEGWMSGLGTLMWPDGRVYEGEFQNNLCHGFGVQWAAGGELAGCGRWADHELVESCPVPRSKISIGVRLSAAVRAADPSRMLLLPHCGHYVGDFNADFKPHGEGTQFRADGSEAASGQWRNGKMHGRCRILLGGGCFEGDFVTGQRSGLGTYTWADGRVYEGEFVNGKFSGLGWFSDKRGNVVRCGHWNKNALIEERQVPRSKISIGRLLSAAARAADPERTLLLPGGGYYVGDFTADFRPDGEGTEYRADGTETASGQWRDGKLHGRGKEILSNGECYEGDFVDDQSSGLGTYTWPDGSVYEGEFSKGNFNGFGVQWAAEDKVAKCGRWVDDELAKSCPVPLSKIPTGLRLSAAVRAADPDSVLLLPHGGHFEGEFNADFQPHGEGTEYYADGSEFASGQWRDGKMHGRGKRIFPNGDRHEGEFVAGQRSGLGTWAWADGTVYEGEWTDDSRSGLGVLYKKGKVFKCGHWADGKLVEARPVPRSKIPIGAFLSDAAKQSALLYANGGFYCGGVNAQLKRHGVGSLHSADGAQLVRGVWLDDVVQLSRKALLIGNGAYEHQTPLRCCRYDAEDMRDALVHLGFECTLLLDANLHEMLTGIEKFVRSLRPGDIVFVYFSGHGEESEGDTFLIPVDYLNSGDVTNAVSLHDVEQKLNRKNSNLVNIIMLDCCRVDHKSSTLTSKRPTSATSVRSNPEGGPTSGYFFVVYSSDPGTVSLEGDGRNSHFTACLLPEIIQPGRLADSVARACDALRAKTKRQRPRSNSTPGTFLSQFMLVPVS